MYSFAFSYLFIGFLLLGLIVRYWLGSRHIRHVLANQASVPAEFAGRIAVSAHRKAADYTIAKTKFGWDLR